MLRLKKFILPAIIFLIIALFAGCELSEPSGMRSGSTSASTLSTTPGIPNFILAEGFSQLNFDTSQWSEFDHKLQPIFRELVINCHDGIMEGSISKDNLEEKVGQYQKFFGPFKLTLKGTYNYNDSTSYKGDFTSEFDTKGSDARVGEGKTLGEDETWPIASEYQGTWSGIFTVTYFSQDAVSKKFYDTITFEGQLIYNGYWMNLASKVKKDISENTKSNFVVNFLVKPE